MLKRLVGGWLVSGIVMALALSPAVARASDPLHIRPEIKTGDSFKYALSMNLSVTQEGGGEPARSIQSTSSASFKVMIDEAAPDRSTKGRIEFERVKVTAPEPNEPNMGFEFPVQGGLPDDAPAWRKLGSVLGGAKLTFTTDSKGNVTITGGFEDFIGAVSKLERADNRLFGFFTPEQFAALIRPIFDTDSAGESERVAGGAWQSTELIPMPPIGAMSVTHNWTTSGLDGRAIGYSGKSTFEFRRSASAPESAPGVTLAESNGFTTATFDLNYNLLSYRKSNAMLKTNWDVGEQQLVQVQNVTVNLQLKN